jgi:hypothetical protein
MFFYFLFGVANIGPHHSHRMQGLPSEEPEEYAPFLPNSPEGPSPEGVVNKDASSETGSCNVPQISQKKKKKIVREH